MLLGEAIVAVLLLVPLTGGSLRSFAHARLRGTPVIVGAFVVALLVSAIAPNGSLAAHATLNFVTYVAVVAVLWRNRELPGRRTITAGTLCNMAAMAVNGGVMPASAWALRTAGLAPTKPGFVSSGLVTNPKLSFLGDIFAVPRWIPFANVFSVGDILIFIGAAFAILSLGGSRLVPGRMHMRRGREATSHEDAASSHSAAADSSPRRQ